MQSRVRILLVSVGVGSGPSRGRDIFRMMGKEDDLGSYVVYGLKKGRGIGHCGCWKSQGAGACSNQVMRR